MSHPTEREDPAGQMISVGRVFSFCMVSGDPPADSKKPYFLIFCSSELI